MKKPVFEAGRSLAQSPRRTAFRGAALAAALLATTALANPALAQGPQPPPRLDTRSATGVSFATGAFSHEEQDLAIGGAEFPFGLTLNRSYLSSLETDFSVYAGHVTQGWTNNLNIRVGNSVRPTLMPLPEGHPEEYIYSVVIGSRSVGFLGGSSNPSGGFVGSYTPLHIGGESLAFSGSHSTGNYTFTDADGTVLYFNSLGTGGRAAMALAHWTAPDGTRADFSYDGDGLRSVMTNRGYALLFEYGDVPGGRARIRACAVNRATTYVTASSSCPAGAQAVTYQYSPSGTFNTGPILTGATNAANETTSYGYTDRGHLGCITGPGRSGCTVSNSYSVCTRDPELLFDPPGMRLHEQVLSQTAATGESYSYSFPASRQCPENEISSQVTMTATPAGGSGQTASTTVSTSHGLPTQITDPLNRTRTAEYTGRLGGEPNLANSVFQPQGNGTLLTHDERGNLIEQRARATAGSGLADIVVTASYPATCANPRTCNRPEYVVDARGNRTDFTYDPAHGGILTETGPAQPNGVRPQTRHEYAQRYARVANGSGGHVQAATPVWVRTATSVCQSSAATGNPAAPCGSAGDEVRTTYDYGPDSGPNNLQLRGQVVTSNGQSLRTCFSYDQNGRRLSETGTGAGATQCQ